MDFWPEGSTPCPCALYWRMQSFIIFSALQQVQRLHQPGGVVPLVCHSVLDHHSFLCLPLSCYRFFPRAFAWPAPQSDTAALTGALIFAASLWRASEPGYVHRLDGFAGAHK